MYAKPNSNWYEIKAPFGLDLNKVIQQRYWKFFPTLLSGFKNSQKLAGPSGKKGFLKDTIFR
ncbi:MAG: hypothetical protein EA409_00610 [Saprospirales bacterium]|nr:MAG: hypothetical protein EA409_00610 [Saprospirales bacterium]